eukprot:861068_1
MDEQIMQNLNNHSLNKLQHFETTLSMNYIPNVFHCILGGTQVDKHLVIYADSEFLVEHNPFYLFDPNSEFNTKAFKTISNITIMPISAIIKPVEVSLWRNICSMLLHSKNNNVLLSREDMIYRADDGPLYDRKTPMKDDIDL